MVSVIQVLLGPSCPLRENAKLVKARQHFRVTGLGNCERDRRKRNRVETGGFLLIKDPGCIELRRKPIASVLNARCVYESDLELSFHFY